jgi:glyoxylase-like metal-dependent hydrolase (beta-lactamase superfamily II)
MPGVTGAMFEWWMGWHYMEAQRYKLWHPRAHIAKLMEYQAPVLRLRTIFFTHLHSDHMSGVAEVLHNTWLYGIEGPITVAFDGMKIKLD